MAITTRSTKGSALTHNEMDDNFNQVPNGADSSITDNGSGIDVTGNVIADKVGIGTSSPANALDIYAGTRPIRIQTSDSGECGMILKNTDGEGELLIGTAEHIVLQNKTEGSDIWFGTKPTGGSNTERMRINSNGQLWVNNLSSSYVGKVVIKNNGTAFGASMNLINTYGSGTMRQIDFYQGASTARVGSIESTTTSTSFNTSSDYRLKENVVDMDGAIDRVKALQPRRFNFIADADTTVDGFLAHEVSDVIPEAISGEKDATREEEYEVTPAVLDDDGNVVTEAVMGTRTVPDYQGIDQSKLVPLLTGALQEAIAKIESLEARITALEA